MPILGEIKDCDSDGLWSYYLCEQGWQYFLSSKPKKIINIHESVFNGFLYSSVVYKQYCCGWYLVPIKRDYRFNWITFGVEDLSRLSGLPDNLNGGDLVDDETRKKKGVFLKPAKLLRALLDKDDVTKEAQELALKLAGRKSLWKKIKVKDRPSEIYGMVHAQSGSIGASCMKEQPANFFQFYDDYPQCKIAYLVHNGELVGRALLWEATDENGEKVNLMDRIYFTNETVLAAFNVWAQNHGYWWKKRQNYIDKDIVVNPTTKVSESKVLKLHDVAKVLKNCVAFPYIDTFTYYNEHEDVLTNDYNIYKDTKFENTDGTDLHDYFDSKSRVTCIVCEETVREDHCTVIRNELVCEDCANSEFLVCENCGDYELRSESVYNETTSGYYCRVCGEKYIITCCKCGYTFDKRDRGADAEHELCANCAKVSEVCEICGEVIPEEDSVWYKGKIYCLDCAKPRNERLVSSVTLEVIEAIVEH